MRITGGKAKSIQLLCPKGDLVRPATDRMRESIFSSIGPRVDACEFLDLFAGTGSYGLEAISRGASRGTFVEANRGASGILKKNLSSVSKSSSVSTQNFSVVVSDVMRWLNHRNGNDLWDLVFVDPPYPIVGSTYLPLLEALRVGLKKDSIIVFESPFEFEELPTNFGKRKVFGKGREDSRCMILTFNST